MFFRRFTTLERLQDDPEDIESLRSLSSRHRLALYNYLTARAYRLNKDELRDSALWVRTDLQKITKGEKNAIPYDREVKPKKPVEFLPPVLNDPVE